MVRIILFFVSIFTLLFSSSCWKLGEEKQIHTKLSDQKEIKKDIPKKEEKKTSWERKTPYIWCNWEKKTWAWLELWVQNCRIKWKNLTINANETLPWYFYEVDSWSWFISQKLAIQVFKNPEAKTIEDSLQKIWEKINTQNTINKNNCKFKKDINLSDKESEAYTLIKTWTWMSQTWTTCWDYEYIENGNKKYFKIFLTRITKPIFINQTKDKQLFDEKSIKLIN